MHVPFTATEEQELRRLVDACWDAKEAGDDDALVAACEKIATFERRRRFHRIVEVAGEEVAMRELERRPSLYER